MRRVPQLFIYPSSHPQSNINLRRNTAHHILRPLHRCPPQGPRTVRTATGVCAKVYELPPSHIEVILKQAGTKTHRRVGSNLLVAKPTRFFLSPSPAREHSAGDGFGSVVPGVFA